MQCIPHIGVEHLSKERILSIRSIYVSRNVTTKLNVDKQAYIIPSSRGQSARWTTGNEN